MAEIMGQIGLWTWFVFWAALLLVSSLLVYLGLGGTFIILALALAHGALSGFSPITWQLLLVLVGIVLLGEGVEFVVGNFYVARKGAGGRAVFGGFIGGVVGALIGGSIVPVLGAVPGSFLGAFVGAIAGEYHRRRKMEPSVRVGLHAIVGRLAAVFFKHALSLVMIFLILRATWPD